MTLAEQLQTDLTTAMKARDSDTVATLRMVLTAVQNARVAAGRSGDLTDEETQEILTRQAKQRRESAAAFDDAGRGELADKERRELGIVERYLPEQLSESAIEEIVAAAVAAAGATGPGDLGKVMGLVMPKVKGLADGKVVGQLVRARLGG